MPTRRANPAQVTWNEACPPQTLMQRGAYLDLCSRTIVSEPDTITNPTSVFDADQRSTPPDPLPSLQETPSAATSQMTFTNAETLYVQNRMCVICESVEDVGTVLANPFAIRCYVGVCKACQDAPAVASN